MDKKVKEEATRYGGAVGLLKRITPDRFDPKPVSESGQAVVRVMGAAVFLLTLTVMTLAGFGERVEPGWLVAWLYQGFAYLWIFVISYDLLPLRTRKWMSIVFDYSIYGFGFYSGGEAMALVFFVPIFSAIGYALRYGMNYARLAIAIGTPLLFVGMVFEPFWREHFMMMIGVLVCFLTLPIYVLKLSEQVIESKRRLEKRAERFQVESRRDSLTGLLNRVGFREQIATQIDDVKPSAILYIDLDGFKAVNDTAGHAAGDQVLKEVATVIHSTLRNGDVVARLGGDEFAASVRQLRGKDDAYQIADNILACIAALKVDGYDELRLGASIGICELPSDEVRDMDELLHRADELMYQAKREGKNRYVAG
ncbi:MAG: GGDEF domain-containing protein [Sideroxydans sp.]|jgi:diguanylate cyclase (GGDEF)-like protein